MRRAPAFTLLALLSTAALAAAATGACSATNDVDNDDGSSDGAGNGGPGSSSSGGLETPDGGSFGGESCGSSVFGNKVPASILVVLDKSGSMSGGDDEPDKWGPTVQALNTMTNAADPALGMGLLPFPAGNFDDSALVACSLNPSTPQCAALFADGGCMDVASSPVVPVGPLSETKQAISTWLASNDPSGNTPTLRALQTAYEIMRTASVEGERYVLLMTDGVPTTHQPAQFGFPEMNVECKQLADIEAETLAAASGAPAVKTFVIGSPGSEGAADFLSQLAINGETPRSPACSAATKDCHYQIGTANFQAELEAALNEIAGAVSDCVFEIPEGDENVDPNLVNVAVETSGGTIETYKDTSHQDGWDYTDSTQTKIQLYGPACQAYLAEEGAKVIIVLGCKTVIK